MNNSFFIKRGIRQLTRLSANCVCISENSATWANCKFDFPLPFPPRRPPRPETDQKTLQKFRIMKNHNTPRLKCIKKKSKKIQRKKPRLLSKYQRLCADPANLKCIHPAYQRYIKRFIFYILF